MQPDYDYIEQLMVQKLSGSLSAEEDAWLLQCIAEDETAGNLWVQTQQALAIYQAGVFAESIDEEKAWDKIAAATQQPEQQAPVIQMRSTVGWWKTWQAVAACAVIVVLAGWFTWQWAGYKGEALAKAAPAIVLKLANGKTITLTAGQQQLTAHRAQSATLQLQDGSIVADAGRDQIAENELNTLSIPDGKDYQLVLPDGSEVWLNAATDLQFPLAFSGTQRVVKVRGEAYFKIAPDAAHPFVVNANGMDIKVLGTAFNTRCYPGEPAATALVSGKVTVEVAGKPVFQLLPGQQVQQDNKEWEVASFDESITLSWLKGVYLFNNEPLQQLKNTIERWYGVQVTIAPELAAKRFSGAMEKSKGIEVFLKNITTTSSVSYTLNNGIVHIF